jgi:hypothetical protein
LVRTTSWVTHRTILYRINCTFWALKTSHNFLVLVLAFFIFCFSSFFYFVSSTNILLTLFLCCSSLSFFYFFSSSTYPFLSDPSYSYCFPSPFLIHILISSPVYSPLIPSAINLNNLRATYEYFSMRKINCVPINSISFLVFLNLFCLLLYKLTSN